MKRAILAILVVCAASFAALTPFVTVAALNTLFGLGLAYTFKTWLAAFWLSLLLVGKVAP